MTRLYTVKRILNTFRGAYIPVSMRETMLNLERELIELESENEKAN
jgi:hypothetical protein